MNVTEAHLIPAPTAEALAACPIGDAWPLQTHLILPAVAFAVPCARMHARMRLAQWRMDDRAETVQLVVSELVTNAIHAYSGWTQPVPYVRLWLSSDGSRVVIQVWDATDRMPVLQEPGADAVDGRGLVLVEACSKAWGCYQPAALPRKVVWSLIGPSYLPAGKPG